MYIDKNRKLVWMWYVLLYPWSQRQILLCKNLFEIYTKCHLYYKIILNYTFQFIVYFLMFFIINFPFFFHISRFNFRIRTLYLTTMAPLHNKIYFKKGIGVFANLTLRYQNWRSLYFLCTCYNSPWCFRVNEAFWKVVVILNNFPSV